VALLLGAVPGVKLDRIGARPDRARLVLPGRRVGLVRQPLGRWLEAAEAGFQLDPGQFAGDGTCLDHRAGRVGDDQTIAPLADFEAVVTQDLVQFGPALRALDWFQAFAPDPAEQALDARVPLHVVGPVLSPALLCLVVVALQPVFAFQLLAELAERLVVAVRVVDRVAGRADLVDGDVQVQVVGVVVHGTDALMLAVTQSLADSPLDRLQGRRVGLLASTKADDQVIGLVGLGAPVLRLGIEHFEDRCIGPVGVAVGDRDARHPLALLLLIDEVLHQAGEVALPDRLHRDVLGDHPEPPGISAAKVLIGRLAV
jgi:hypothetical protein